ncbi:MAG: SprB repeat-containing protein, partial [Saprospiraceae bacterium]
YALSRKVSGLTAYGFAYAAIGAPPVDDRGKLLVFVDSTSADALGADLIAYKNDLRGEGWQIIPFHTGPFTTVQGLKNMILSQYNADPSGVKAILLIGDVPVPYSGGTAWDNRPDHVGAWPCDAFYGDINGVWTDNSVNLPGTARTANRNVPGDGKFDQNTLPSAVELPVGRLDFRHLSAATFGLPPVELLRRYFIKNHRWRTGQFAVPNRALVDDNLGWSNGEAFAADGFRNAYPLVGSDQVITGDFLVPGSPPRYLLGYGAGTNGGYSSAGGIGTANDFATDSINMVVATLYGDYFGDWDYENNPLLPALLASKGGVLACAWAGHPHWLLQGLAVGETMGFCLQETQNAQYNEGYGHLSAESSVPISLLGDPTLRLKIVRPATNLTAVSNCNQVNLHWTASTDPEVLGYLVYRAFDQNGPYTRLTPNAVTSTAWSDQSPAADMLYYAVRALKFEVTPGGGNFYNTSTGALKSVIFQPGTGPTVIGLGGDLNCTTTSLTLGANFTPINATVQWYKPDGSLLNGFIATQGGVYTVVATAPNGCTAVAYASVIVDTFLPQPVLDPTVVLTCTHPVAQFTVPEALTGVQYFWNDQPVQPGAVIYITGPSVFKVTSMTNGCSKSYPIQVIVDAATPVITAGTDGNNLDCTHSSVQLMGSSNSSLDQFTWSGNGETFTQQNPVVILPGTYCLTVTGANGCTSTACVSVLATGEAVTLEILTNGNPCGSTGAVTLNANVLGGTAPYQYAWSNGSTTANLVLPAGYSGAVSVTVTDAHGCVGNASINLTLPLSVLATKTNESSPG